jgi:tetratricopeptide (TPR) repeat protein
VLSLAARHATVDMPFGRAFSCNTGLKVTVMKSNSEKRFILFIAAVFYMCMTVVAVPAQGDDKTGAKKHFDAGLSLLEAEDFAGAAAEFDASVKLFPTKNGLFNLANCLKALHQYDEALAQVARLKELFANNLDAELKAVVANLEAEIRAVVAELTIQVDPGLTIGTGVLAVATAVVMAIDLSSTESQERSVTVAPDGIAVRF